VPLSSLKIEIVSNKDQIIRFLALPDKIYKDDSSWRPPLKFERKAQINPISNPSAPSFDNRVLFIATKNGEDVGRIAAFINEDHNKHSKKNDGFFGFFDFFADNLLGQLLLESAENWLKVRGVERIIGPANWSVNEECGLLISGFDTPPVVMMLHGKEEYKGIVEDFGYTKAIDMFAYQAELSAGYPRPKITQMMVKSADRNNDIKVRSMRSGKFRDELNIVMDIFNDAWSENWGFVPFDEAKIEHMANEIRPIMFREGLWIGEYQGKPIAYIWMIPDVNEAIEGLNGSILPFGWVKLFWRLKIRGVKQARIPLMGLRKEFHNTRIGLSLVAKLCETVFEAGRKKGFSHCELSWILENNSGMISICEQASAVPYKKYRMYQKKI
jgi:GNAT superfamily N-acetyltransferase